MELKNKLYENFKSGKLALMTKEAIAKAMRLPPSMKKKLVSSLSALVSEGKIYKDFSGRYATARQFGAFTATVKAHPQGFAFLIPEGCAERENDYFVPAKRLGGAYDKDVVLAMPVRGTEDEAAVLKIIERGRRSVVGRFERGRGYALVIPDDPAFLSEIYIPLSLTLGARHGDKVVAEITSYPRGKAVGGKVTKILGEDGDFFTEESAIIHSFSLREQFPERVLEDAERVSRRPIVCDGRRDLREILTITIDGEDTRDIDDAVSCKREGDTYVLGVHIADVSGYVAAGSELDGEAYERGTSVYFPDRVLPMLPKALSNGACSLNEGEDRYALSCIMTFDKRGNKIKTDICESVIRSDRRMTYTEVAAVLDGGAEVSPRIDETLKVMRELTLLLEAGAKARGAVELDVKEAHIFMDGEGEIVIPEYERNIAHRLIERFMIAANESVASYLQAAKLPCLYRIHEPPTAEKAAAFYSFIRDLGLSAPVDPTDTSPKDYQKILKQAEYKPYFEVINSVMLRSMQKARYCEVNGGHFGLASPCYCHFTSPIRRYPDLFVHRVLKCALRGKTGEALGKYMPIAHAAGIDCSRRERNAEAAEREVDELHKAAYMQDRIGEVYDAVISGVIESAVFARLANTIEGVIRLESLPDDEYAYYEGKYLLKGARHSYRIGDPIRVKVAGCDAGTRRVHFVPACNE